MNTASAVSLLVATLLIKLGLRREPDAWRRTLGMGLRSEASKFALSAFGLQTLSDQASKHLSPAAQERHFVERFARFLQTEPDAQFALKQDRFCTYRVENAYADVTLAQFSPLGELQSVRPVLDERCPLALDESRRLEVEGTVVEEYNRTRHLPERARAAVLLRNLNKRLGKRWLLAGNSRSLRQLTAHYGERIIKSCCVSFEPVGLDVCRRFEPPDFRLRRVSGLGFLNLVCRRLTSGAVDVWMQVHHTGADGVPMQDLLTRLEKAWGTEGTVLFPFDSGHTPEPQPCYSSPQERYLYVLTDFIDFTPLIVLRQELKERFAGAGIENISLGCLFLWCLAYQPEFDGVKFASAVDVLANETQARAVDLIPICPGHYMNMGRDGFAAFVRDFNQLMVDARCRRTRSYLAMRRLALLPPVLAAAVLKLNPAAAQSTFGTVGVSIVRDAKVVVGPMADAEFAGGFILIGSMSLPCSNGGTTTAVSIKGEYAAIRHYPSVIRRAIREGKSLKSFS